MVLDMKCIRCDFRFSTEKHLEDDPPIKCPNCGATGPELAVDRMYYG